MPRTEDIERAISKYAKAYAALECLQDRENEEGPESCLIPKGDQKTGCIGEFYAMRYADYRWSNHKTIFGHHSQKGWDIKVEQPPDNGGSEPVYIQVKTASAFGEGKLGKITKPTRWKKKGDNREYPNHWDELWVFYLNRELRAEGFWTFECEDIDWTKWDKKGNRRIAAKELSHKRVPSRLSKTAHPWFTGNPDSRIGDLRTALRQETTS